ncbi:MAG: hypothetical protein AAGA54_22535 [Myxococcota bacterium]
MSSTAHRTRPTLDSPTAQTAEKSTLGAVCGEVIAPAADVADTVTAMLAMNLLRIPKPRPIRRKQRESQEGARLELTLEMPRHTPSPKASAEEPEVSEEEPKRGVAEVDFYI